MNRFIITAVVAAFGLTTFGVTQTFATDRDGGHMHRGMSERGSREGHSFHASDRFDYGRHGFRSFSYSHYRWSSYYHCYCYYAPSYGWCFYEPCYSCYVSVSRYFEVYPEATHEGPPPVFTAPTIQQQQTTVVVGSPTTPGPVPVAPVAPVAPAPTALQQTKVGGQ
jgi:hypothetical protein